MSTTPLKENGIFTRFLNIVEKIGNKLPHPFILFLYLAVILMIVSAVVNWFDVSVVHPTTEEKIVANSLLSKEGVLYMLSSMLDNFTGFAPFGLVIVMMFGIGLAQKVGFFETFMKKTIIGAPKGFITYTIIFIGVLGNIASDAAMIIIPPLAGMVYYAIGRHPLAGMAAAFAGVGIGFTANFLIAGTDALLSGITTEAAQIIIPEYTVTPVDNWFFMSASVFMLVIVGAFVTDKIVEPRLGTFDPKYADQSLIKEKISDPTSQEVKGLRNAVIAGVLYLLLLAALVIPANGFLRSDEGTIIPSPFISNIIPIILIMFILVAVVYGKTAGTIKKSADVPILMGEAMKDMSGYIVLIFAAAQFISYFNWTNLSTITAISSSSMLQNANFTGMGFVVCFILLVTMINLVISSGSAQWALMAPVFVPLFMLLNYDPAFAQLAYRIGDSTTNNISPVNPYVIMVLGFMKRYDSRFGFGSIISLMLPYTLIILVIWIVMFVVWNLVGIPIGPGTDMFLNS